jgi:hypothetical protein
MPAIRVHHKFAELVWVLPFLLAIYTLMNGACIAMLVDALYASRKTAGAP